MKKPLNNIKKEKQLNMSLGKATAILKKAILYSLAEELSQVFCFHCNLLIDLEQFSIEHKVPWLYSNNPKELFFNRENIAFSHLSCNSSKRRSFFTNLIRNKDEQLEQKFGTANNKLKRKLIFNLLQDLNRTKCFICNNNFCEDSYSIEHKVPWLDSDDPVKYFFELSNISFSHKACNFSNAKRSTKKYLPEGYGWCWSCKKLRLLSFFAPSKIRLKSLACTQCCTLSRRNYTKN